MVNWESSSDRGRRPPTRGRGQRSAQPPKPAPSREQTTPKAAASAPAPAPRGSPIARKLARHSSSWTTLTIPQLAVQVRPHSPDPPDLRYPLHLHHITGRALPNVRPRSGTASSLRGSLVSRAGSPASWVPCLPAPPEGCRIKPGYQPRQFRTVRKVQLSMGINISAPSIIPLGQKVANRSPDSTLPPALLRLQEGETTLAIAHY